MLTAAFALMAISADVSLSGIVLAKSGRHAATLSSEGRNRSVLAGDKAFGCEVSSIKSDSVDLKCGGERRSLKLVASTVATRTSVSEPAVVQEEPSADITMNRAELQARLDNEMSRLMTETTLIPVSARGQISGFTLSRVPAGTILETIGLKAGDVLTSVNETPIDSFTTLVGLWPRLQASGAIRAQILRDGRPMDISVSIK